MELLEAIDAKILAFFTKISHRFQRLTGRTNFFLAKAALCLVGLDVLAKAGNYWLHFLGRETSIMQLVLSVALITFIFKDMYICDKNENNALDSGDLVAEPTLYVYRNQTVRLMFVFITLLVLPIDVEELLIGKGAFIFRLINALYYYAITAFFCFIAVDPLPPGKSKIREWVETFSAEFSRLVPARSEASR